jgi:hypothetical protein
MEEQRVNNAKIAELEAKAAESAANAQSEAAYAQVAAVNAQITQAKQVDDKLNERISHLIRMIELHAKTRLETEHLRIEEKKLAKASTT